MDWKERALALLKDSLEPVPSELNEIDWKSGLSDKSDRLAQHISAFANHLYGGILVYGVNDDGSLFSLGKEQIEDIVKKLGNIAHQRKCVKKILNLRSVLCVVLFAIIITSMCKPLRIKYFLFAQKITVALHTI